jgi:hypothetical protein
VTEQLKLQSEASWQQQVYDAARLLGWRAYHTRTSIGSAAGFPDLILVRRPRVVVAELKREDRDPTADQSAWLDDFRACGIEAYVWKPSDWPFVQTVLARCARPRSDRAGPAAAGAPSSTSAFRTTRSRGAATAHAPGRAPSS